MNNSATVSTSPLLWLSRMDIDVEPKNVRKSSIICTIGPKTNNVEMITKLRDAGMNVARMNFSHGSYEYHGSVIKNVRDSFKLNPGNSVAIALDTKGPEIRTGLMTDNVDVPFKEGHEMIFTTNDEYMEKGDISTLYIDYKNITKVIEVGKTIYVDDGIMSFEVLKIENDKLYVKALSDGKLSSKKGVNLPNTNVDLPALSEKDISDLKFGVEQKVDMVFASFIRTADNIKQIRSVLGEEGKNIKIIAKIENYQGVKNFDEILEETDGVMVARGDLGIEIPCTRVFIAQKSMITKCNIAGKPVICATQMLESMTNNPRPTRAEISDVANAILDGADCVMLSGETAKGNYPIEAVQTMSLVCSLAESVICYEPLFNEIKKCIKHPRSVAELTCASAVSSTIEEPISAIFVLTTSGESARLISKYRPPVPIISICRSEQVCRQLHLYRGCYPLYYNKPKPTEKDTQDPWQSDVDQRLEWGIKNAIEMGMLKRGDYIIAVQGWKGGLGNTNSTRILQA